MRYRKYSPDASSHDDPRPQLLVSGVVSVVDMAVAEVDDGVVVEVDDGVILEVDEVLLGRGDG